MRAKPMVPLAVALLHCEQRDTAEVAHHSALAVPTSGAVEAEWCTLCERTISPHEQSHAQESLHETRRVLVIFT